MNADTTQHNAVIIDTQQLAQGPVRLELFNESYADSLCQCAADPRIWQHHKNNFDNPETFKHTALKKAKRDIANNTRIMFVIFYNDTLIGSTSYYDVSISHRRLHIGYTWMHPDFWGLGINPIIKQLMLNYAFRQLKFKRVAFCIDSTNLRSRAAIEKLNIPLEGILRNHQIRPDGSNRDSAIYAITESDWELRDNANAQQYRASSDGMPASLYCDSCE